MMGKQFFNLDLRRIAQQLKIMSKFLVVLLTGFADLQFNIELQ